MVRRCSSGSEPLTGLISTLHVSTIQDFLTEEREDLDGTLNTQGETSHQFSNNQHLPNEGRT